ncbi:MAG TPA: DUF1801 domain-containing protein [Pedobacter sp.]|nr:DUF1801 domain-containing protein [Pedobacter sp.]
MTTSTTDSDKVSDYLSKLDPALAEAVERIRQIILASDSLIAEQIKWNAPSFYYTGAMKPFNPKEYKRDIVVLNLHKGKILLVLPTGARIKEGRGLLEGNYTDGRRLIRFKDLIEINDRAEALTLVIGDWIAGVE